MINTYSIQSGMYVTELSKVHTYVGVIASNHIATSYVK